MKRRLREGGRRVAERLAPTVMASVSDVPSLRGEVTELRAQLEATRARVEELEAEIQETRRLHRRVAEVTDVVEDVLLPATSVRDEGELRRNLDRYVESF